MSVDPAQGGVIPSDPQSWNAYAYARNNPLKYVDPDGQAYIICEVDSEGKTTNCSPQLISDNEFRQSQQNLSGGVTTQTEGRLTTFTNSQGDIIGVAVYFDLGNEHHRHELGLSNGLESPAIDPVLLGIGVASAIRSLAPGIIRGVANLARGTGPQIVKLELDPALHGIGSLSNAEINALIGPQQRELLKQLFGQADVGAEKALTAIRAGAPLPQGLTRATLLRYREIAVRAIREGADIRGTQALRIQIIDATLKSAK